MSNHLLKFVLPVLFALPMQAESSASFLANDILYRVTDSVSHTVEVAPSEALQQMTSVTIPATVTDGGITWRVTGIGDQAFYMSEALQSVTLPEGITHIGYEAFRYSTLSSVNLPASLVTIGHGAFGETALGGTLVIPDGVTTIGAWAFTYTPITALQLGQATSIIGAQAFADCYWLAEVAPLPQSLTTIGIEAFANCNIHHIDIPGSVREIEAGVFNGCYLQSVELGEGIETIGDYAFSSTPLTAVELPASVRQVGRGIFAYTPYLQGISVNPANRRYTAIDGVLATLAGDTLLCCPGGKTGEYVLPATIRVVANGAFDSCTGLTAIMLNEGLTEVGAAAFESCYALDTISVPESIEIWHSDLTETQWYKRQPDGMVYAGPVAFSKHCTEEKVYIKPGTRCIADFAFEFSDCVKQVVLPKGLLFIGYGAFSHTNLKTVRIPSTVKYIDTSAFSNIRNLNTISFPAGLETMGSYTLASCINLKNVIAYSPTPPEPRDWYHYSLIGGRSCTLYCPSQSVNDYSNVYNDSFFIKATGPEGDVNHDNVVDIDDANKIINTIIKWSAAPQGLELFLHDLNGDNQIDIDDLNELVNILLKK